MMNDNELRQYYAMKDAARKKTSEFKEDSSSFEKDNKTDSTRTIVSSSHNADEGNSSFFSTEQEKNKTHSIGATSVNEVVLAKEKALSIVENNKISDEIYAYAPLTISENCFMLNALENDIRYFNKRSKKRSDKFLENISQDMRTTFSEEGFIETKQNIKGERLTTIVRKVSNNEITVKNNPNADIFEKINAVTTNKTLKKITQGLVDEFSGKTDFEKLLKAEAIINDERRIRIMSWFAYFITFLAIGGTAAFPIFFFLAVMTTIVAPTMVINQAKKRKQNILEGFQKIQVNPDTPLAKIVVLGERSELIGVAMATQREEILNTEEFLELSEIMSHPRVLQNIGPKVSKILSQPLDLSEVVELTKELKNYLVESFTNSDLLQRRNFVLDSHEAFIEDYFLPEIRDLQREIESKKHGLSAIEQMKSEEKSNNSEK